MKFIPKHGKSEKDIHNLRQEIEVFLFVKLGLYNVVQKIFPWIFWRENDYEAL